MLSIKDKLSKQYSKDELIDKYIDSLNAIEKLTGIVNTLTAEIDRLKNKIAELEKRPKKPKNNNKPKSNSSSSRGQICKSSESSRKSKTSKTQKIPPEIHKTEIIQPDNLPEGARFKGYKDYIVQDLKIETYNTCYRRACYEKDGKVFISPLPEGVSNHYAPGLTAYILNEYFSKRVTEELIYESLREMGCCISTATISNIITGKSSEFEDEYNDILKTGLYFSEYIQADDTGAKHKHKRGYCTVIGNEAFAWYMSTDSKSRLNFLQLLNSVGFQGYVFNDSSLEYLSKYSSKGYGLYGKTFSSLPDLENFLNENKIKGKTIRKRIEEAGLFGTFHESIDFRSLFFMSDNAGQFNIFSHLQCWVHAERNIKKIDTVDANFTSEKEFVLDKLWECYFSIKNYKTEQNIMHRKKALSAFEAIVSYRSECDQLKEQINFLKSNREQFLAALYNPRLPLHNNLCENDVRQYVMKREISGSTKSDQGKNSRDIFISLKVTCRKCGIKFYDFLKDRLSKKRKIPEISSLIKGKLENLKISTPPTLQMLS